MVTLPPPRTTELYYDGDWNDISGSMRDTSSVTITRGVSAEGNRPDPGKASATLDNRSGDYSPRNPNSDLYGKIGRNTAWKFSIAAGGPWAALTSVHHAITTPNTANLGITGDIDVRADVTPNVLDYPQQVAGRYQVSGDQRSWALSLISLGQIQFSWSPDGTLASRISAASTVPVPAHRGQRVTLRATLDVDNGAGGWTARFYTARTVNGPWTELGDPVVGGATTSIHAGTAMLELGSVPDWSFQGLEGKAHGMQLRTGISGTLVVDVDIADQATAGDTTLTDATGRTWTARLGTVLSNLHTRMVGEVPAWPPSRDLSGADVTVPITPAGIMRRLGAGNKPLDSALRRFILGGGAMECWPLTDGSQATQGRSLFGSPPILSTGDSSPHWGQGDLAEWIEPVLLCPVNTFGILTATPTTADGTDNWAVDLFRAGVGYSEALEIRDQGSGSTADPRHKWTLSLAAPPDQIQVFVDTETTDGITTDFLGTLVATGLFDGQPHHLGFSTFPLGGFTDWAVYVDGVFIGGGSEPLMGNPVGRIEWLWDTSSGAEAEEMSLGYLTYWNGAGPDADDVYQAFLGFPGEYAGTRALRVADERGLTASMFGQAETGTRLGTQMPEKFLDTLNTIAGADLGYILERRDELELIYRGRDTLYNQTPLLTLDWADGLISAPFRPIDDDKLTENDVTVKRQGGTSSTQVLETGRMSVLDPPDGVSRYDVARTLSLETDAQTGHHAYWRLHLGTHDGLRYTKITIDLGNPRAYALIDDIYRVDVGDLLRLQNLPADQEPGDVDLIIRGYTEEIGPEKWTITFNCEPGRPWSVGVVGDYVQGRADTDGTELAAAVTATDTVLPVTVTAGRAWVTAPPNALSDPGFEAGTGAWVCTRGTSIGAVSWERTLTRSGTGALRITRVHLTDSGTMNLWDPTAVYPAAPGQVWAGRAWVYHETATVHLHRVAIVWRDAGGTETFIYGTAPGTQPGVWTQVTVSATLPAGAVGVRLGLEGRSSWTVGQWWQADDVRLARTDSMVAALPDEFPFDVTLGGEQVTVTSITGLLEDSFGRTVASGWGTAGTGQTWVTAGGAAADYAVTAGTGRHLTPMSTYLATLVPVSAADVDLRVDFSLPAVPAGDAVYIFPTVRYTDSTHMYIARVLVDDGGAMSLTLRKRDGTETALGSSYTTGITVTAGTWYTVRLAVTGSTLTAKVWRRGYPEPAWQLTATDSALTAAGSVGVRTLIGALLSNPIPFTTEFDNVLVTPQQMNVGRSVNGIVKAHSTGTDVRLTHPTIVAL